MADEPYEFVGVGRPVNFDPVVIEVEWVEFEGDDAPPGTRLATYEDYAAELGLTPTEERAHFEYVREVLARRGMLIPEWKPNESDDE